MGVAALALARRKNLASSQFPFLSALRAPPIPQRHWDSHPRRTESGSAPGASGNRSSWLERLARSPPPLLTHARLRGARRLEAFVQPAWEVSGVLRPLCGARPRWRPRASVCAEPGLERAFVEKASRASHEPTPPAAAASRGAGCERARGRGAGRRGLQGSPTRRHLLPAARSRRYRARRQEPAAEGRPRTWPGTGRRHPGAEEAASQQRPAGRPGDGFPL